MTSPAQVRALFCALYAVNEDSRLTIYIDPMDHADRVWVSVGVSGVRQHGVEVAADDPNPLAALREDLAGRLMEHLTRDLNALVPYMASVPALAPLIQVGLMLRLGRAFVRLRRACAPGAGVGGEKGRAAQHAFDDAARELMVYVGLQGT